MNKYTVCLYHCEYLNANRDVDDCDDIWLTGVSQDSLNQASLRSLVQSKLGTDLVDFNYVFSLTNEIVCIS